MPADIGAPACAAISARGLTVGIDALGMRPAVIRPSARLRGRQDGPNRTWDDRAAIAGSIVRSPRTAGSLRSKRWSYARQAA